MAPEEAAVPDAGEAAADELAVAVVLAEPDVLTELDVLTGVDEDVAADRAELTGFSSEGDGDRTERLPICIMLSSNI